MSNHAQYDRRGNSPDETTAQNKMACKMRIEKLRQCLAASKRTNRTPEQVAEIRAELDEAMARLASY